MTERDWSVPLLDDVMALHSSRWGQAAPLPDAERAERLSRVTLAVRDWVPSRGPWQRFDDAVRSLAIEVLHEYEVPVAAWRIP